MKRPKHLPPCCGLAFLALSCVGDHQAEDAVVPNAVVPDAMIPVASETHPAEDAAETTHARRFPNHRRPIIEDDGRTLLWANDREWFDVTEATIDPYSFQFGIGKDRIASIDQPRFVGADDPLLAEAGINADTPVLGVVLGGEAHAYPVAVMDMHEVVNDSFDGQAYAVLW